MSREILGMFSSVIAVVGTDEADIEGKQNCVLCSMAGCGCGHAAFTATLKAFFPTDGLPNLGMSHGLTTASVIPVVAPGF